MQHEPEPIINLGATICSRLKIIFYPHTPWIDCYKPIANQFTELKKKMRIVFPDKKDIDIVKELIKYSNQDLEDILG